MLTAFRGHLTRVGVQLSNRQFAGILATAALLGCIVIASLHPFGYIGSGFDDMRYVAGVECLVQHGFCVPTNHWEARLPFLYPAAAIARLFGESREALWIAPLLFATAGATFLGLSVSEIFGRAAGVLATAYFLLCPEVANRLVDYMVDLPEFAFLAGGSYALLKKSGGAAGIAFGLAVLCRPTVVAFAPIAAVYLVKERQWRLMVVAGIAIVGLLIADLAVMWALTGDPVLTWRLSFHHNLHPTSPLHFVPFRGNPLFNMDLVAAWPPVAGIDVPWSIRPPVNFLGYPTLILLHAATITALLLARDWRLSGIALAGAGYFITVAYGFAIDPKPRMFMPVIAAECAIIGAYAARASGPPRMFAGLSMVSMALLTIVTSYDRVDIREVTSVVRSWLIENPAIQLTVWDESRLELRDLRRNTYGGGPGRVAALLRVSCREGMRFFALPADTVIEKEVKLSPNEPSAISYLRSKHLFVEAPFADWACLYAVRKTNAPN